MTAIICPDCGSTSVDLYKRDRRIGPTRVVSMYFCECYGCGHIANSAYTINGGTQEQAVARFLNKGVDE